MHAASAFAELEARLGIGPYITRTAGTGGRLRSLPEDFVVEEDSRPPAPAHGPGKYTIATVRATNWETNRLVAEIARRLRIGRGDVYFAGTKDKRAVKTQQLAIKAPLDAVQRLALKDVEILAAFRADQAPKIGHLYGNRFTITVRDLACSPEEALRRCNATAEHLATAGGAPNFFGPQRFGSLRPTTHEIGEKLLRGELPGALLAYVGNPIEGEPPDAHEARRYVETTHDYAGALDRYPRHLEPERAILSRLAEKDDPERALRALPPNLQTMFIYAFQSLLFNRMLSERIRRGLPLAEPLDGDLLEALDRSGTPDRERFIPVTKRNLEKCRRACARAQSLTTGLLVGYDVPIAAGVMGEIERSILGQARVHPELFQMPHLPHLASRGTRRELVAPIRGLALDGGEDARGGFVRLQFTLHRGSYATSVLREFTKADVATY